MREHTNRLIIMTELALKEGDQAFLAETSIVEDKLDASVAHRFLERIHRRAFLRIAGATGYASDQQPTAEDELQAERVAYVAESYLSDPLEANPHAILTDLHGRVQQGEMTSGEALDVAFTLGLIDQR